MTVSQHDKIAFQFAEAREAAGKTQADVADFLGVTYQAVSNWEHGRSKIDSVSLLRALQFFGVDVYDFFERCGFDLMHSLEGLPAFSAEALRVAAAYDRADERTKQIVDLALDPFTEKRREAKTG